MKKGIFADLMIELKKEGYILDMFWFIEKPYELRAHFWNTKERSLLVRTSKDEAMVFLYKNGCLIEKFEAEEFLDAQNEFALIGY